MSEQAWMCVLSILVAAAVALLTTLIVSLRVWKKEIRENIAQFCKDNKEEHQDIWDRVNHHWHNGGGNVVIPNPGGMVKGG